MLVDFFFFKQKTAYELRISDWSSDVCSSDLHQRGGKLPAAAELHHAIADGEIREREQDELRRDGPGQDRHRRRIVAEGEGGLDAEEQRIFISVAPRRGDRQRDGREQSAQPQFAPQGEQAAARDGGGKDNEK